MELPQEYIEKMTALLGTEEFSQYQASLEAARSFGIRVNSLKLGTEEFVRELGEMIGVQERIPWTTDGFYYDPFGREETEFPGKLPFYHAGLYYIQEPSAMYPAEQLDVKPGDRVLDLCAAPGGKSTKLAAKLQGEGLLVANDISEERVKALIYNIELAGVKNAVVTNEAPERLVRNFAGFFDKILVDAPCSGEGMFRKDTEAVRSWGKFKTELCVQMQQKILESAHLLLKCGGHLLYSTCTFDLQEDENMIRQFMQKHPEEYQLITLVKNGGISDGLEGMHEAARLWPHKLKGEGHFAAMLEKKGTEEDAPTDCIRNKKIRSYQLCKEIPAELVSFWNKNMCGSLPKGYYYTAGDGVYFLPCPPPDLDGLKAPKIGLNLGELNYGKFKPSQQFAMAYGTLFKRKICFSCKDDSLKRYLRGETLTGIEAPEEGWSAVCVGPHIIGMGILKGGVLKNLYPKGWRRMI